MTTHPTPARTLSGILGILLAALGLGVSAVDSNVRNSPAVALSPAASPQATQLSIAKGVPAPSALLFPDPDLHPGVINPGLSATDLCAAGFTTKSIRPRTSYTNKLKSLEIGSGGQITDPNGVTYPVTGENLPGQVSDYELDHLISLELGGNPFDPKNLWMEPWERRGAEFASAGHGAESKDVVENRLHREVCAGQIALSDAQREIATDWTSAR